MPALFSEESFLFVQIKSLCQRPPLLCPPHMGVVEAAVLMRERQASGLVVVDGETPLGVVSVTDLRNLIADTGGQLNASTLREIMSDGVISVRGDELVFEAVFRMAQHNIHRLVVLDAGGGLLGMINDDDLLRLQTRTPLYLSQDIERAASLDELGKVSGRMIGMVGFAARAGTDTRSLVQLISHLNDAFTVRVIALLDQMEDIRLPPGAAYLAMGSEGRGEQTLRTDQDSAIVYADELPEEKLAEVERFAVRLAEALETIGVPRCPGDSMASNPYWRRSLSNWQQLLDQWITVPKPEHLVNFGMFQDFRTIWGDAWLADELHGRLAATLQRNSLYFPYMARHICGFQPPLGFFGHFRVERRGEHRGELDLKKAGIFAITAAASLLALENGMSGGSTWTKLDQLRQRGLLPEADAETVIQAYTDLVKMRLERQLKALESGRKPSNHLNPLAISERDRTQLRQALRGVGTILRILRERYRIDFISR